VSAPIRFNTVVKFKVHVVTFGAIRLTLANFAGSKVNFKKFFDSSDEIMMIMIMG